jgi:uncharacterized iron-regulated protein
MMGLVDLPKSVLPKSVLPKSLLFGCGWWGMGRGLRRSIGIAWLVFLLPWGALESSTAAVRAGGTVMAQAHQGSSGYTPQRVYDTKAKRFVDFEAMLFDLSRHNLVLVGEQHDDPATHRLERAILEGLARRRGELIVSLEMFERDVQGRLDEYLAGKISEETFLAESRPWPNYLTDYRPLLELARVHRWPVVASNIPRKFASRASREGLSFLSTLSGEERSWIAREMSCPMDAYYRRFEEAMSSHPSGDGGGEDQRKRKKGGVDPAQQKMLERFYLAQCLKDETMAESIVERLQPNEAGRAPLVVHFNGAFHSDYRLGTASRIERRAKGERVKVVSILPVGDLDAIQSKPDRKRADYLILTLKPRPHPPLQEKAGT